MIVSAVFHLNSAMAPPRRRHFGNSREESSRLKLSLYSHGKTKPESVGRKKKKGVVTSIFRQAIIQAGEELSNTTGSINRLKLATSLGYTFLKEVVSLVKVIPYGVYALRTHKKLTPVPHNETENKDAEVELVSSIDKVDDKEATKDENSENPVDGAPDINSLEELVKPKDLSTQGKPKSGWGKWWPWNTRNLNPSIARDIRYGPKERNLLDIYVPPEVGPKSTLPVLFFLHGGVWASGEKWQFAPLGARVARSGAIAVIVQYTLYPEVLAREQSLEADLALTWTMDNIAQYGGDKERIFLVGHSSGAHLASLVLWNRARWRILNSEKTSDEEGEKMEEDGENLGEKNEVENGGELEEESQLPPFDSRLPFAFLGLSGVYEIGEHFRYEERRGVAVLSCMAKANGGFLGFPGNSPALLVGALGKCLGEKINLVKETGEDVDKNVIIGGRLRGDDSVATGVFSRNVDSDDLNIIPSGGELVESGNENQEKEEVEKYGEVKEVGETLKLKSKEYQIQAEDFLPEKREASIKIKYFDEQAAILILGPDLGLIELPDEAVLEKVQKGFEAAVSNNGGSPIWPPTFLMVSPNDTTVPPTTSFQLAESLKHIGVKCRVLGYDGVDHGAFACWKAEEGKDSFEVRPLYRDILDIVLGKIKFDEIDWNRS